MKKVSRLILYVLIYMAILVTLSYILTKVFSSNFKDTLFIQNLLLLFVLLFSGISNEKKALSIQGLGEFNAQYISTSVLSTSIIEKENKESKNIYLLDSIPLFLSCIFLIIICYFI